MQVAEKKIKEFMSKVKISTALEETRYHEVKIFFVKFTNDARMIKLMKNKKAVSPLPEDSDIKILSKALTLQELWFVTTDGHFKELTNEIEQEFGINVVTDYNAYKKQDKLLSHISH